MKSKIILLSAVLFLSACMTTREVVSTNDAPIRAYGLNPVNDQQITQSLFGDKSSTISETDIQKILDNNYTMPKKLRVAIVKLEGQNQKRYYWSDEQYLKSQQAYLDLFSEKLKQSPRVAQVSIVPEILLPSRPSFTSLRESAVRMQADVIIVYSIASDLYSRYKAFTKTDIKAFATTQLAVVDVRTGLIPFSTIVTKDYQSKRQEGELSDSEASSRVKNEAVLMTINTIGQELLGFLK